LNRPGLLSPAAQGLTRRVSRPISSSQNRQRKYRIGGKWIAQTDVSTYERIRDMAGLRLDPPGRRACAGGARHEAGAERVPGVPCRCEANRPAPLLHDGRDGVARELTGQHMPAPGEPPEHRPFADPGQLKPFLERLNRTDCISTAGNGDLASLAFLVGLAFRN